MKHLEELVHATFKECSFPVQYELKEGVTTSGSAGTYWFKKNFIEISIDKTIKDVKELEEEGEKVKVEEYLHFIILHEIGHAIHDHSSFIHKQLKKSKNRIHGDALFKGNAKKLRKAFQTYHKYLIRSEETAWQYAELLCKEPYNHEAFQKVKNHCLSSYYDFTPRHYRTLMICQKVQKLLDKYNFPFLNITYDVEERTASTYYSEDKNTYFVGLRQLKKKNQKVKYVPSVYFAFYEILYLYFKENNPECTKEKILHHIHSFEKQSHFHYYEKFKLNEKAL